MKHFFVIILVALSSNFVFGQNKYDYVHFNKLIEVEGSDFVIAMIENRGKLFETKTEYLLFINTIDGTTQQVDFPRDADILKVEQIKIDSLQINKILVYARTVDLNGEKGIEWADPAQIIVISSDGKDKVQLTDDNFFVRTWTINKTTGKIVIAGHYDSNNNHKYDKTDKNEILIYDLKTLKSILFYD
jgi:hypothetical protein